VAGVAGEDLLNFHLLPNVVPINHDNLLEAYLSQTWRPSLTITGVDGLPATTIAGNVIRAWTKVKVSIRLPPTMDAHKAKELV